MTKKTVASKAFRFSPSELELLEKLAHEHGSYKDAVMAGLEALAASKITRAQVMAYMEKNLK